MRRDCTRDAQLWSRSSAAPTRWPQLVQSCGVTRRLVIGVGLVVSVLGAATSRSAVAVDGTAVSAEASAPPHVVALVPSVAGLRLKLLDARTLTPARPGWSRVVPQSKDLPAVLSPDGSRVAVAAGTIDAYERVLVLDTSTGRVLERWSEVGGTENGFYWLGDELLVTVGFHCSSGVCGDELSVVGSGATDVYEALEPVAVLREGLVLASSPTYLLAWGPLQTNREAEIELSKMSAAAPFYVVTDVTRSRVFAISSAGLIAQIDRIFSEHPTIRYHRVALNGRPFEAAWAGGGKIALWGPDGLGAIDTRTWAAHAVAPAVTGALATRYGLAAWTSGPDGLSVYTPDGTRRLHVLPGKRIKTARAVGTYLYADTDDDARHSIDLRTGKTSGPLPATATIIAPTLVAIP